MPNGTVVVVTPPTNSLSAEMNSYQVQFTGPGQMFTSELWVTKPISGSLERICNQDGTWIERVFFTTSINGAVEQPQAAPTVSQTIWDIS